MTSGTAVASVMCDAMLDLVALTEAAGQPGFAAKREAILGAWQGREGVALVYAAILLIHSAVSELDDPQAWLAQARQQALAGQAP